MRSTGPDKVIRNCQKSQKIEEIEETWISGHLYYHQSLNPVVIGFVRPLVVSLVKDGQIDAFFFVRNGLGGPHVRLRLGVIPGGKDRALKAMQQSAQNFLDLEPSIHSVDEEAIRRSNEFILASDPHEIDNSVYPDNSFQVIPFRPEIQRYGGPGLFEPSLDFFTLSSVAAIEFLSKHANASRSAQLAHVFRLLLEQALGFAADEAELFDLLRYGVDSWGKMAPKVIEKGDKVASSQKELFLRIFRESQTIVCSLRHGYKSPASAAEFLATGASMLSEAIGFGDRSARARIGGSQLHMTATRLGLGNAEEVYLSRLLTATLQEACTSGENNLSWIEEKVLRGSSEDPAEILLALLPPSLSMLVELAPMRSGLPSA